MAGEERPVQIIPDPSLASPRVYANYVQVSASPIDCTLTFCDVIGPQSEEEALRVQKSGVMNSPVRVVVVIPNQIIDGLIQALQAQRDKQVMSAPSGSRVQ